MCIIDSPLQTVSRIGMESSTGSVLRTDCCAIACPNMTKSPLYT